MIPATCPTNSNWFEFVGQVPGTCPLKLCWSLRPNENNPITDQYFRSDNRLRTPFQDGGRGPGEVEYYSTWPGE